MTEEPVTGAEHASPAGQRPDPLPIAVSTLDDVTVICPSGEIDYSTGPSLHEALAVTEDRPTRIVLDLSHVTFMDSTGINILLVAHKAAGQAGGWLRLAGCTPPVERTVQLVGLDTVIPCYPTRQEALSG